MNKIFILFFLIVIYSSQEYFIRRFVGFGLPVPDDGEHVKIKSD